MLKVLVTKSLTYLACVIRILQRIGVVLFVLTLLLWAHSYGYEDTLHLPGAEDIFDLPSSDVRAEVKSSYGMLTYTADARANHGFGFTDKARSGEPEPLGPPGWPDFTMKYPYIGADSLFTIPRTHAGSFMLVLEPGVHGKPSATTMPAPPGSFSGSPFHPIVGFAGPWRVVYLRLPHWALALLLSPFLIPILLRWRRDFRSWRRRRRNLCVQCAYDLRGTPERCPECGLVAAGKTRPIRRVITGAIVAAQIRRAKVPTLCLLPIAIGCAIYAVRLHYSHWRPPAHVTLIVHETVLGPEWGIVSPDYHHCAYGGNPSVFALPANRNFMVLDGKNGPVYDNVYEACFSPDSKHSLYVARDKGKEFVVVDGKEGPHYDQIRGGGQCRCDPVFSPDSKRFAYVAEVDGRTRNVAVIDGVEGPRYDYIGNICFSPDSRHVGYTVEHHDDTHIEFYVVDGIEGPKTEFTGRHGIGSTMGEEDDTTFGFSDDSKRIFYFRLDRGIVSGITTLPAHGYIWRRTTSPDATHFAYQEILPSGATTEYAMIDGREEMHASEFTFSPDSKHSAYVLSDMIGQFMVEDSIVIDRKKYPIHSLAASPTFSPDSQHLAYVADLDGGSYLAGGRVLVWDSHPGGPHWFIRNPGIVFSPDSRHVAVWAMRSNSDAVLMVDQRDFQSIPNSGSFFDPVFSPDNKHLAYGSVTPNMGIMYWGVDGDNSSDADAPELPNPPPDPIVTVMVDGQTAGIYGPYGQVEEGHMQSETSHFPYPLVFDSPTSVRGVGIRNGKVIRFDIDIKSP